MKRPIRGKARCRNHGGCSTGAPGNKNRERHGLNADRERLRRKVRRAKAALAQPGGPIELVRDALAHLRVRRDSAIERHPEVLRAPPGTPEFEALAKNDKDMAGLGLALERQQTEAAASTIAQAGVQVLIQGTSSDSLQRVSLRGADGAALEGWRRPDGTVLLEDAQGRLVPAVEHRREELGCTMYSLPPHDSTANEGDT